MHYLNPLTSPGEGVTAFISPYLSAGAPTLGEAKGLIHFNKTSFYFYFIFIRKVNDR